MVGNGQISSCIKTPLGINHLKNHKGSWWPRLFKLVNCNQNQCLASSSYFNTTIKTILYVLFSPQIFIFMHEKSLKQILYYIKTKIYIVQKIYLTILFV